MPAFRSALALTFALAAAAPMVGRDRHETRFAFCEQQTCHIEGMSSEEMKELRRKYDRVALFDHRGVEYLITDDATLDRIRDIFKPQVELGRKQAALGAEQAKLGGEQARLGSQQAALGARQAALALRRDADGERAQLDRQQSELGRQQSILGEQQSALGDRQSALGRQQAAASREAKKKLAVLIEDAVRTGKAKRR